MSMTSLYLVSVLKPLPLIIPAYATVAYNLFAYSPESTAARAFNELTLRTAKSFARDVASIITSEKQMCCSMFFSLSAVF